MSRSEIRKKQSLATAYSKMTTDTIARRLQEGGLVPLAQEAAQAELQRRRDLAESIAVTSNSPSTVRDSRKLFKAILILGLAAGVLMWIAWLLVPGWIIFLLLFLVVATGVAYGIAFLSKAFPPIGIMLALGFAVLPIAIVLWPGSRPGGLEGVLFWTAWFLLVLPFSWGAAYAAICGARHQGTWDDFHRMLSEQANKQSST